MLSAQYLHRTFEHIFQVLYAGCVCRNNLTVQFLCQSRNFTHTYCYGSVRQSDYSTFFYCSFSYFPRNGLFVQSTENNPSFSFSVNYNSYFIYYKFGHKDTNLFTDCRLNSILNPYLTENKRILSLFRHAFSRENTSRNLQPKPPPNATVSVTCFMR